MMNVECMNTVENIYNNGEISILDINDMSYFDEQPYDILDNKDFTHYISDLERIVRNSFEYRQLISYLKNTQGMDVCSFLENVTSRDNTKVKIEIHHSPLTLYDICMGVFKKRQANKEDININAVAEEVMWLHYVGWVGLIPLSETVHDMVHNQYIFIPTNLVRGNYQAFVNSYYNYIDPDTLDALDNAEDGQNGQQDPQQRGHDLGAGVAGRQLGAGLDLLGEEQVETAEQQHHDAQDQILAFFERHTIPPP